MRAAFAAVLLACACTSRPAVPILDYHAVGRSTSQFDVTIGEFEEQLDWLAAAGFRTVDLAEAAREKSADRAVALTFDDGSADALDVVLPALRQRGMRATFFIVSGRIGLPGYLTWEGVRTLDRAGMAIGSHTAHHARLPDLSEARAREELLESKREIEAHLGHPIDLLAYPYNSLRSWTVSLARDAGYRIAVAGPVHGSADPMRLYRLPVRRGMGLDRFKLGIVRK